MTYRPRWIASVAGCALLALAACSGTDTAPEVSSPQASGEVSSPGASRAFKLTVGHCWFDPVVIDGETWGVDRNDQFGWGGGAPENWTGVGELVSASDQHLVFVDEGGHRVDLRPLGDSRVFDPKAEKAFCD